MAENIKTNLIFLGCNYNNKKIKRHFDSLKSQWENEYPVHVCLIDRDNKKKGSEDIWKQIKTAIGESSLSVFDLSGFRPNVVLELGYALAVKANDDIIISFDERGKSDKKTDKKSMKKPEWQLSDIGHLNQVRYKLLHQLKEQLEEKLDKVPSVQRYKALCKEIRESKTAGVEDKYISTALNILKALRQNNSLSQQQVEKIIKGTSIRIASMTSLLKKHNLAKRTAGRPGRWTLIDTK